ncbi:MAG: hypothetical protein ACJ79A_13225 [Gemmatimonadaceae bacterium]
MRRPFSNAPLSRLILLTALVTAPATSLDAQTSGSSIEHALYVALGGDPAPRSAYADAPLAVSAGVERSRAGSRWSMRLGADYRRQTSDGSFGSSRSEDFGVNLSARYGRASGSIRPYLLGGIGVADLRMRMRDARYYVDPEGLLFPPVSYDRSRWNGSLITGIGTDFTFGRLRLFTEARINAYPAHLSGHPRTSGSMSSKALYLGVKF